MSRRPHAAIWGALLIVYVVWGSTYLGIKVVVDTVPPLLAAGTRFVAAGLLLAGVLLALRRPWRATRREALSAAAIGVALLTVGVGLVHVAEQRIDSGVAAVIAGTVPLQVVLWRTLAGERVRRATIACAVVGLLGLAVIVVPAGLDGGATAVGLATMLCGTLAWSRGSFTSGRLRLPPDPFVTTTIEMLAGGAVLLVVAAAAGELGRVDQDDWTADALVAWAYLVVFGSVIAFTAYAWLLHHAPISRVVTHQYVNPLVALALGAMLLDERPTATTLLGAGVIVLAVVGTLRVERVADPDATGSREPVGDGVVP